MELPPTPILSETDFVTSQLVVRKVSPEVTVLFHLKLEPFRSAEPQNRPDCLESHVYSLSAWKEASRESTESSIERASNPFFSQSLSLSRSLKRKRSTPLSPSKKWAADSTKLRYRNLASRCRNAQIIRLKVQGLGSSSSREQGRLNTYDKTIRLWNTQTGDCLNTLMGHAGAISALAILPDGTLASGSYDTTIRLWGSGPKHGPQLPQSPLEPPTKKQGKSNDTRK